jgi:hypothetical protein
MYAKETQKKREKKTVKKFKRKNRDLDLPWLTVVGVPRHRI